MPSDKIVPMPVNETHDKKDSNPIEVCKKMIDNRDWSLFQIDGLRHHQIEKVLFYFLEKEKPSSEKELSEDKWLLETLVQKWHQSLLKHDKDDMLILYAIEHDHLELCHGELRHIGRLETEYTCALNKPIMNWKNLLLSSLSRPAIFEAILKSSEISEVTKQEDIHVFFELVRNVIAANQPAALDALLNKVHVSVDMQKEFLKQTNAVWIHPEGWYENVKGTHRFHTGNTGRDLEGIPGYHARTAAEARFIIFRDSKNTKQYVVDGLAYLAIGAAGLAICCAYKQFRKVSRESALKWDPKSYHKPSSGDRALHTLRVARSAAPIPPRPITSVVHALREMSKLFKK